MKRKEVYKQGEGYELHMDIFMPEQTKPSGGYPAIVFFFGGGWVNGSPEQFYPQAEHFAKRGVICFCAEYRVHSRHGTSPLECVEDGISAVAWIRNNQQRFGIDPNRLIVSGGSAGGHVAVETVLFQRANAAAPNACVLFNPVLDTTEIGYGAEKMGVLKEKLSPFHQLRRDLPPMLIFHGDADKIVPVENATRFKQEMDELGNDCELSVFEQMGHGFFNFAFQEQNGMYLETMKQMEAFLQKRGLLTA